MKRKIVRKLKENFCSPKFWIIEVVSCFISCLIVEGLFGVFGSKISTPYGFFLSCIRVFLTAIIVKIFIIILETFVEKKD